MRARQAICHASLIVATLLAAPGPAHADDPPGASTPPVPARSQQPGTSASSSTPTPAPGQPADVGSPEPVAKPPAPVVPAARDGGGEQPKPGGPAPAPAAVVAPGNPTDVKRTQMGIDARLKELATPDKTDNPAIKPILEVLGRRSKLLVDWTEEFEARNRFEHPKPSPEELAAEFKADLEKTRAVLDQATKTPAALLPEVFGSPSAGAAPKPAEDRLAEMKEAIDSARRDLKDRSAELEKLRSEAAKNSSGDLATLRTERDKIHQSVSALAAGRGEKEAAIASAGSAEARELALDRFTNYEWECRVEAERLAAREARIALAAKRGELGALRVQAKANHVELGRRLLDLMEKRYASQSERQQNDLKQAVAKEETKAARTEDVLERYRARRSAELLELEAQTVAHEKANATTPPGLSVDEQKTLADRAVSSFETLKTQLNDGNVSSLDLLRLKNAFRQIGPLRASIVRGELAEIKRDLTTYENALADVEVALVNDSRDDRFGREALLDKLPERRHHEAEAVLSTMETRHLELLNRSHDVLQKLAQRSEDTQTEILRRIAKLDEGYAFIRTRIFWVRDAEPVGPATLAHARDEAIRAAKALIRLTCELGDGSLWGRMSPDFVVALVGLVVLPWPLRLGRQALDRLRLAAPDPTVG